MMLILGLVAAGCGTARQMPNPNGSLPQLRVLVFYDPALEKPQGTVLPLISANRSAMSALAPDWYKVMPDGSLRDLSMNNLKTFATTAHLKLTPLIVNYQGTSSFLENATARTRAVNALATMLKNQPSYTGLNIDFELLKPSARSGLTMFMQQLYAKTQAMGKTLTIDIIPAGSKRGADQAYDYPKLAKAATDVVLMTYDAHDSGSNSGPVAPLAWVTTRVKLALQLGIPANRLIVGLADYGYEWVGSSTHAKTLSLPQVEALIAAHHITVQRSSDGSPHFTYTVNGVVHTVWYEDGTAIQPIIKMARSMHVAGLALWMGGYETAAYWHALRSAAGTAATGTAAPMSSSASTPSKTSKTPSKTSKTSASSAGASSTASTSSATSGKGSSSTAGSAPTTKSSTSKSATGGKGTTSSSTASSSAAG
jgi:spore germination protein YaaH